MAYKQRWLTYFDVLDSNKNGSIDIGDAATAADIYCKLLEKPVDSIEVQVLVAANRAYLKGLITAFDTNHDNKVSKEELIAGVEKTLVGHVDPDWWRDSLLVTFKIMDVDISGALALSEVISYVQRLHPEETVEAITAAYEWAVNNGPSGRFDINVFFNVNYVWATSPDAVPEAVILTPTFH